jgi:hypothetical protein
VKLSDADYTRASQLLGCDVASIRAVAAVESAGTGFLEDGRPKILFEAHVFSRLTGHAFDESHPNVSSRTWNRALYEGGAAEHGRLEFAARLNRDAALQAASWGKFQLMGFNWQRCGAATLQEFINAMYRSEGDHLTAFCHYIKSSGLDDELRRHDWAAFARGYNGPGFAANKYDALLAASYDHFSSTDRGLGGIPA